MKLHIYIIFVPRALKYFRLCVVASAAIAGAQIPKNTNALNKDLSLIPDGDEKDFDDYDYDLADCMEDDD